MTRFSLTTLLLLHAAPAIAQPTAPLPNGSAYELDSRHRWLHGGQHPRFTPFLERHGWLVIDSMRAAGGGLTLHVRTERDHPRTTGRLEVDSRAWPTRVVVPPAEQRPRSRWITPAEAIRFERHRLSEGGAGVQLPETLIRSLLPLVAPEGLDTLTSWRTPIDHEAEAAGVRQRLRGVRISVVVGDTLIDGVRHILVRDSASVSYSERWPEHERTLDTTVVSERTASGVIRGRTAFLPGIPLGTTRVDSTSLLGEAVLTYPDGRTFRTPARYERVRRWRLRDPAEREARLAARAAEERARDTGMLRLPVTDLERRLYRGDERLRDSLLTALRMEPDPNERRRLEGMLTQWAKVPEERIVEMRLEDGDTPGTLPARPGASYRPGSRLTARHLERLLPQLRDPGRAWELAIPRDPPYENIREALLNHPPALIDDTLRWPCAPAACRLLAAEADAPEPRLRDLALIARMVMDPRRWSEEVVSRAAAGSAFLQPAALLARGVGATWQAASRRPLPPAGAHWRDWLEWQNGHAPEYHELYREESRRGTTPRFDGRHATAIRFFEARTGRDVVGELRERLAAAESDSARLVFDVMLVGLDDRTLSAEELTHLLLNGTPLEQQRARWGLHSLFEDAAPAEPVLATELTDRLLRVVLEGEEPWPLLDPTLDRILRIERAPQAPVLLLADSLPPGLAERWADRVRVVGQREFRDFADAAPGYHVQTGSAMQVGPFVRLYLEYMQFLPRAAGEAPKGHAGGVTVYLLHSPDGWLVVSSGEWVT